MGLAAKLKVAFGGVKVIVEWIEFLICKTKCRFHLQGYDMVRLCCSTSQTCLSLSQGQRFNFFRPSIPDARGGPRYLKCERRQV